MPHAFQLFSANLNFEHFGKRILGDSYEVNVSQENSTSTSASASTTSGAVQSTLFGESDEEDSPMKGPSKGRNITNTPHTYFAVTTDKEIADLKKKLLGVKEFAFDTETTGLESSMEIVGMSFSMKTGEAYYVPTPLEFQGAKKVVQSFKEVFENPKALKVGHNIKFDMKLLMNYGVEVADADL